MTPSKYQQAILEAEKNSRNHIIIDAKAGSGKTSTLKMIVGQLSSFENTCMLAFNKSIASELEAKLPRLSNLTIRTCHSAGMQILKTGKGGVRIDDKGQKVRDLLQFMAPQWGWDLAQQEYRELRDTVHDLINLSRLSLAATRPDIRALADKHNLEIWEDEDVKTLQCLEILKKNRQVVDFTDMIWLPAISDGTMYTYPKYTTILVDECQDLSAAQQAMIMKMLAPGGRLIAVGDPQQAIYGFAGADSDSFKKLLALPGAVMMPLNECFRCGKAIIDEARKFCPTIEAFAGNSVGEVRTGSVTEIKDGDFVLCRNTLPLVKLCYKLIGDGKAAYVKGRDIGASLANLVKKCTGGTLDAVSAFCDRELAKHFQKLCRLNPQLSPEEVRGLSSYITQEEKIKIIKLIIANNGEVVDKFTLIAKIEKIFKETQYGGICLSTVHRAKGLEADRVFLIDRHLMPSKWAKLAWQKEQETNLQYVATTRAKQLLCTVNDWTSEDEKDEQPQESTNIIVS